MKKEKSKYSILSNICFLLKDMWGQSHILVAFIVMQMILSVIVPLFGIYLPALTVDLITSGESAGRIIIVLGVFGLIMAVTTGINSAVSNGKYMLYNSMRTYYMVKLFMQSLYCDYSILDNGKGQTQYERAYGTLRQGDWSGTSRMTVAMINVFVCTVSFVLYSGIISMLNIYILVILVVLSSLNYFAVSSAQKFEHKHKDASAIYSKKLNYIEWTSKDSKFGKDIRLYGFKNMLLKLKDVVLEESLKLIAKIQKRYFIARTVNAFLLLFRDILSYGYLVYAVINSNIDISEFVLYFGAITGFSSFVSQIIDNMNELSGSNLQMNDLRAFIDNTDAPAPKNPTDIKSIKEFSIEFKNVSFSYEDNLILENFSLMINNKESIALVGVNGVGKTTLVKLLCGLVKPSNGEILIGGVNISNFKKEDLFAIFSTVFQDIAIFPFTLCENVSMQTIDKSDINRVNDSLTLVGLDKEVEKYEDGIYSYMGKEVNDGIIFSGGQQQKLLMARAIYKNAPILILDEPTAALDPIAESETYESFNSLSHDKTSIYISHRLASTKFCDKIVLIKDKKPFEIGTHDELMKKNGEYAKIFEIQSHYYNQSEGKGDDYEV